MKESPEQNIEVFVSSAAAGKPPPRGNLFLSVENGAATGYTVGPSVE